MQWRGRPSRNPQITPQPHGMDAGKAKGSAYATMALCARRRKPPCTALLHGRVRLCRLWACLPPGRTRLEHRDGVQGECAAPLVHQHEGPQLVVSEVCNGQACSGRARACGAGGTPRRISASGRRICWRGWGRPPPIGVLFTQCVQLHVQLQLHHSLRSSTPSHAVAHSKGAR